MSKGGVQSVERSLLVLEELASTDSAMGITELASRTKLPYATVHRLLTTLVAGGYVRQQTDGRRYLLGTGLVRLGAAAGRDLGKWSQALLEELAEVSGETANLAFLQDGQVVYLAQAQSHHRMRMFTEVGSRAPAHSTGVGKVLLAYRSTDEVEEIMKRRGLEARTEHTIVTLDSLTTELEKVAEQGFAIDDEEAEIGVRCVAVPVWDGVGSYPIAAISISGPASRLGPSRQDEVLPEMLRIAKELMN